MIDRHQLEEPDGLDGHDTAGALLALPGYAEACWQDRFTAALDGYAGAVAAALRGRGLAVTYTLAAGIDLAWIDLTVPALTRGVRDASVYYSDELGWHYHPEHRPTPAAAAGEWARLVPVTAGVDAAEITPAPAVVADAITALRGGAAWPTAGRAELRVIDALAGHYLDRLIDVLEDRCPILLPTA